MPNMVSSTKCRILTWSVAVSTIRQFSSTGNRGWSVLNTFIRVSVREAQLRSHRIPWADVEVLPLLVPPALSSGGLDATTVEYQAVEASQVFPGSEGNSDDPAEGVVVRR